MYFVLKQKALKNSGKILHTGIYKTKCSIIINPKVMEKDSPPPPKLQPSLERKTKEQERLKIGIDPTVKMRIYPNNTI